MHDVIFHIKIALQYLKYAKKVPDKYKEKTKELLEEALKEAETQKAEWK